MTFVWTDIALTLVIPTVLGILAAALFWWNGKFIVGNAVGVGVVFAAVLFVMGVIFVDQLRANQRCAAGGPCHSLAEAHLPFLGAVLVGFIDACILFSISLWFEERQRAQGRTTD